MNGFRLIVAEKPSVAWDQWKAVRTLLRDEQLGEVERKNRREKPPLLYDLTNLQKEANRRFRFSAKRTLELAHALFGSGSSGLGIRSPGRSAE